MQKGGRKKKKNLGQKNYMAEKSTPRMKDYREKDIKRTHTNTHTQEPTFTHHKTNQHTT